MLLNIVWPIFILISFFYSIFSGNLNNFNTSIFESTSSAVNLCITLLGTMCLWNGIMEIANKTSIIDKMTNFLKPFMRFLFPEINEDNPVRKEISMNVVANILGLGNAATPLRIKSNEIYAKRKSTKRYINKFYGYVYCTKYCINTNNTYNCYFNKKLFRFK